MAKGTASRAFVWVILGLLIVALAGFGATNFGGSVRSVAMVGDMEVLVDDYGRELQQDLRALAAQSGRAISLAEARALGLDAAVLSRLVSQAALDNETARINLSVGDEMVRDQVAQIPAFRGIDGSFDREAYAFTLGNTGLSVAEFEERVRNETARNILQGAVINGVPAPQVFTDTLFNWALEERDVTWALLDADDLSEPLGEPSDADLQAYYDANEAAFTLSETKAITYAWVTPRMILDTIDVDEDALRSLFEQRASEYIRPERRLVERLVFADSAAAEAARAQIDAAEMTFDDLIEDRGLSIGDVDLGDVTIDELDAAGEEVFALTEPGIAGPLPSPLGPALFRVNAILSASETSFDDARDELAAEYASDRASRLILDMRDQVDDLLAGGATIEELAEETELELGQIDWRQGVEGGIADYLEFRDAALIAEAGDFPEMIEIEEGGLFALRVDELRPPELQPLQAVRSQVIEGWELAETARLAEARAQEAAQAIRDGREMAGLDLPLRAEMGMGRNAFLDDAPDGMVDGIFQMSLGDVRVFQAESGAALVRLDTITPPDPDGAEAEALKANFNQQAIQDMAGDVLLMFTRAIQNSAGVQVNQQAINAVHAQFP